MLRALNLGTARRVWRGMCVPQAVGILCNDFYGTKYPITKQRSRSKNLMREYEKESPEELEDLEEESNRIHDWMSNELNERNGAKQQLVDEQRSRKSLAFKIIQRKYFKGDQEKNLLTWNAKEQIRFLHAESPDEWTVERLAESFPVSKLGVVKLLRSTFALRNAEEVERHDNAVRKNWAALKGGGGKDLRLGGPLTLARIANQTGCPELPAPSARWSETKRLGVSSRAEPVGLFESIVKDYCESKKNNYLPQSVPSVSSLRHSAGSESLKMIEGTLQGDKVRSTELKNKKQGDGLSRKEGWWSSEKSKADLSEKSLTNKQSKYQSSIDKESEQNRKYEVPVGSNTSSRSRRSLESDLRPDEPPYITSLDKSLYDVDFDLQPAAHDDLSNNTLSQTRSNPSEYRTMRRTSSSESYHGTDVDVTENLSLSGTVKLSGKRHSDNQRHSDTGAYKLSNRRSSNPNPVSNEPPCDEAPWAQTVTTGVNKRPSQTNARSHEFNMIVSGKLSESGHRRGNEEPEDVYTYDENEGYQHPYGRIADLPQARIKVKDRKTIDKYKSRGRTVVVRKGNEYFDEDGGFLYRVS